ncbi:MAG: hypothetical protein GXO02_02840 [Epsilonproteobacteria bacterium]|nr:hypothetical protein [Campylobacterota bacterium]
MGDLVVTFGGLRIKAKNLDDNFLEFVQSDLEASGVNFDRDNEIEKLLKAYLRLAAKSMNYEKEIEKILKDIDT